MADIDIVLERLVTDAAFREQLTQDPASALSSYDLGTDDLELLASSLDSGDDSQRGVEQRTSKSAVVGLLASLTGGGGGGGGGAADVGSRKGYDFYAAQSSMRSAGVDPDLDGGAPPDDSALTKPPPSRPGEISVSRAPGGIDEDADGGVERKYHYDKVRFDRSAADDAPPDESAAKLPGKPKPGEITLTRSVAGDVDGDGAEAFEKWSPRLGAAADAPPEESAAKGFTGGLKAGDTSVDGDGAAERHNEKWMPRVGAEGLAPPGEGEVPAADFHTIKLVNAGPHVVDDVAPPGSGDVGADDLSIIKLRGADLPDRMAPGSGGGDSDGDFLTIEDE